MPFAHAYHVIRSDDNATFEFEKRETGEDGKVAFPTTHTLQKRKGYFNPAKVTSVAAVKNIMFLTRLGGS